MIHRQKLGEARQHLGVLESDALRYLASNPYRLLHRHDMREERYTVRAEVVEPLPDSIPARVAATLHCARAALDHLASALAGRGDAASPPVRFPIHESFPLFAQRARKVIRGMADGAQAEIEGLQPYHNIGGPRGHPLWTLAQLDAVEGRRLAAGRVREGCALGVNTRRKVELSGDMHAVPGPFEHGAVIAEVRARVVGPDPKLDLHLAPEFELAFARVGAGRGAAVIATLTAICELLEHLVLPRLEPYIDTA